MSAASSEMDFLPATASAACAFAALTPPVRAWFQQRFGEPTAIQRSSWPAVSDGRHVLVSAPTGTGKTLAALLPLVSRLFSEPVSASPWPSGLSLVGLYVSP